uniref:ribosomal protein S14 n=1 Tax=Sarcophyte sanguinea TaxID=1618143 RepID=UPI0026E34957|nr:ribosomal protein S14 [Sarcophyte sanguinea]WJE89105.1 ribosomal protein S14 [Sarcophyte sanguinea]WJE89124.1 ribosomal protein S14 [Sarcophyte sanguinea]
MPKKSWIQREKKKNKLKKKFYLIHKYVKEKLTKKDLLVNDKWKLYIKLQSLPRNSIKIRLHQCCFLTGKPKSNLRDFGLSRYKIREMINSCLFPGTKKLN